MVGDGPRRPGPARARRIEVQLRRWPTVAVGETKKRGASGQRSGTRLGRRRSVGQGTQQQQAKPASAMMASAPASCRARAKWRECSERASEEWSSGASALKRQASVEEVVGRGSAWSPHRHCIEHVAGDGVATVGRRLGRLWAEIDHRPISKVEAHELLYNFH